MNAILKKAALAAALVTASLSAHAAESHIQVYADVDLTLALLKEDGSALPTEVRLTHVPGLGLTPHTERVRIYTNDEDMDVGVRLITAPSLVRTDGAAPAVPLTVSLMGRALTVAEQDFLAADLYSGALEGHSVVMDLNIGQTTRAPLTVAGKYEGMVSIAMVQKAGTP
ncbi:MULTISPECIES: CS1 type fimbrial major subunit [Stenotrophomonas]|uniref:CS1 type fimbrial major subunit n=1 Tax=Stenotrophomonas TaxID=40323 RepID=UPI0025D799EF|nr:CS1 type fimbrial major subunit [Stenotrophomonas sp.]